MKILVLGGYGVFGSRLARLLLDRGHDVLVAGRSATKAETFVQAFGGRAVAMDRDAPDFSAQLAAQRADVVVDAAGPFQAYGAEPYRVAQAALDASAHYIDLSDDAAFTKGIGTLDRVAGRAGTLVLSGTSSVPAISSAVADVLVRDMDEVGLVQSAICPGNRAPRGRSVMAAILSQIGAPLRVWRGGAWRKVSGWSGRTRFEIARGNKRAASFIGAPDLTLFPGRYRARSVLFRAGLELGSMHRSLAIMSWLRSRNLMPAPLRFQRLLHWLACRLEPFGSDTGGMVVEARGMIAGRAQSRVWRCFARGGDGPFIPTLAAVITVERLANDDFEPGARPALGAVSLAEVEQEMERLSIQTEHSQQAAPHLFEQALGTRWAALPTIWRDMHRVWDLEVSEGRAEVTRGSHLMARIIAALFRFPPAGSDVAVKVTMERRGTQEIWTRQFGKSVFRSVLSPAKPGHVYERFGPFSFLLELTGTNHALGMEVRKGWCFGVPMPRFALPRSIATERVKDGKFTFDVDLSLPGIGRLVHYRGWLQQTGDARNA